MTPADVGRHLRDGLLRARWSVADLWIASLALGGRLLAAEVDDITSGLQVPKAAEYELLALTLNEYLRERDGRASVPYWSELSS